MAILIGVTVLDQHVRGIIHDEGITPPASDLRNRIEAAAIARSREPCPSVKRHTGEAEILRSHIARPRIFDAVELYENPAVILIIGGGKIGNAADMFDSAIVDAAGPGVFADGAAGITGFDGAG